MATAKHRTGNPSRTKKVAHNTATEKNSRNNNAAEQNAGTYERHSKKE